MGNYLINPLWIYLIDLFGKASVLSFILMCVFGGILLFIGAFCLLGDVYDEDVPQIKRWAKRSLIWTCIVTSIFIAIPSQKTMYTMFVASYITEENLNSATETVTDVVDYIFEKVDELQGE